MATTAARPRSGSTVVALQARQAVEELRSHAKFAPLAKYALAVVVEAVGPSKSASERAAAAREVPAYLAVGSGARDVSLALLVCEALDVLDDDDVLAGHFRGLVAAVAPRRVWRDAVDRATGDVVALKLVKAAAATPEDDGEEDADDALATPRCAMTLVRLLDAPETERGRVALDALSLLLQGHGLRAVAARRALATRSAGDGTDGTADWLRRLAAGDSPLAGRCARSALRFCGVLVATRGLIATSASAAEARADDIDGILECSRLALDVGARELDRVEHDAEPPRTLVEALAFFVVATEAVRVVASDHALATARARKHRRVREGDAGALARARPRRRERRGRAQGRGDLPGDVDRPAGASSDDFAFHGAEARRAARLAAALYLHEARDFDAAPELRAALKPAVLASRAAHRLSTTVQLDLDALERAALFVAGAPDERPKRASLLDDATMAPPTEAPTRSALRAHAETRDLRRSLGASAGALAALSAGLGDDGAAWTQRVDESGVPYFEDGRETTWRAPDAWVRAARAREGAAGGDPAVVRRRGDWAERSTTRRVYYANEAADLSQWERPDAFGAPPDDGPDARVADDGPDERPSEDGPDSPPGAAPAAGTCAPAPATTTTSEAGARPPPRPATAAAAPRAAVRASRIVGFGGGGGDDDAGRGSGGWDEVVAFAPPRAGAEEAKDGAVPSDGAAAPPGGAAPPPHVRRSRTVGMGGGDDDAGPSPTTRRPSSPTRRPRGHDEPAAPAPALPPEHCRTCLKQRPCPCDAAAAGGGNAGAIRVGDLPPAPPRRGRVGAVDPFPSRPRAAAPPPVPPERISASAARLGGYDDAAGRDMPYGGGTPIDADSVGAPRTAVRGSRIVGFGGGGEYDDPAAGDPMAGDQGGASPSVRGSRIVGYGGGDYDDPAADALGGSRGPGHGPPPVGGYDDAAGQGRVYGGGTPIEDPSAAAGYGGGTPMGNSAGAPRTAVRGSRIVGFGGGGEYDDPAAGDPMAGDRGDAGPSMRGSRIVGYGGGGDYDDPAADALGGSRGPGHGPPPVGGYDDAAGQGRVYGGGTPIEDPSAAPGYGGGTPMDDSAGAQRTAVRGSRIVGFGGGEYDDPARRSDGRRSRRRGPVAAAAARASAGRGYDDAAGRDMPYGGGTPIDADSVGAPRTAVRGSRIVGFGGGEYDDPAAAIRWPAIKEVRARRCEGVASSATAAAATTTIRRRRSGRRGLSDARRLGARRGPPRASARRGYDDAAGRDMPYGGGTPIDADSVGAPRTAVRGAASSASGGGEYDDPAAAIRWRRSGASPSVRGSRIVGYGGGGDYDDPAVGDPGAAGLSDAPGGSAQRGRGPGRGPPPVGGYDDAAGRDMPYGGGTPIDADSVGGAPRTAVRGSRIVGFGGGGEYDDPAADALGGLRGPGHGPPPVGGYDDAAGQGRVYGGGTRIEDPSAAPGYGGGTPMDDSAGAPRTAVRGAASSASAAAASTTIPRRRSDGRRSRRRGPVGASRIVGYGGGGDYDDPAVGDPGAAGSPTLGGLGAAPRPGRASARRGYDDAAGRDMPYGGGTPIDADSVGAPRTAVRGAASRAPRTAVRGSRIVGFGGGGEYDDPAAGDPMAGDQGGASPSVRGSRIVGYGGGGDYDDPAVGDPGAAGLSDAPGGSAQRRGAARASAGRGYDDAAGRDMPYGGGTPIDADSVGRRARPCAEPHRRRRAAASTTIRGRRSDGRRSRRRGPVARPAAGLRRRGYDDAAGRDMPYGGGTPIDADSVGGAPRTAVRGSRIVGFGGGGEYDDPAAGDPMAGDRGDAGPSVRGSRIVGYGGGGDYDDPPSAIRAPRGSPAAPALPRPRPRASARGAPRTAVRGSRIVGFGGGGEYDDPAAGDPMAGDRGDAGPSRAARPRRASARRGYDDAAGRDMPYGGGTPIDADSVGAPRTAVRGSRIVGFGGARTTIPRPAIRWPAIEETRARRSAAHGRAREPHRRLRRRRRSTTIPRGDPMAGDRGDAGPSVRGSRIVGYGGGGDYDDPAVGDPGAAGSPTLGGSAQRGRGPGRGPPPVGGYDDAAGRDMPYGGGTPIDADSVGERRARPCAEPHRRLRRRRVRRRTAAAVLRTNLRDSRMVGPDRGTETPGESSVYDGGDPSDAAAGGPGFRGHTSPVRASRIVGMGGGGEGGPFDTPGARDAAGRDLGGVAPADVPSSVRDASAPAVRGAASSVSAAARIPRLAATWAPATLPAGPRRARGAPPAGGYDDAAGPGRAYGGGTPIDAPGVSVRGSRIVGFGGGDEPAAGSGARSDWDESVSFVAPLEERAPPPPWVQAVDPATGATYYSNPDTGESSWTRPLDGFGGGSAASGAGDRGAAARAPADGPRRVAGGRAAPSLARDDRDPASPHAASEEDAATPRATKPVAGDTPASGPWRCPKCGKGNGSRRSACSVCATVRADDAAAADAGPSVRGSRIVGMGGGDDDTVDDDGWASGVGGGAPIEDPAAAPYGGGTPIRGGAADPTGVRKSRIVGIGGGGGANPAPGGDWDETVSFVPPDRPPADIGSPWREFVDPLGVPYFHNDQTQETTWIAPDDWVRDMRAKDPVQRSKSIVRAANDWQEKVDPASGRVYYITPDGQTQWERPESVFVEGEPPESILVEGDAAGVEKPGVRKSRIVGFGGGGDADPGGDRLELPPKLEGIIDAPECAPVGRVARASSRENMTTPELPHRAPRAAVRGSRIVGFGGGSDDPAAGNPMAGDQGGAPRAAVRGSRIVGFGGGADDPAAGDPMAGDQGGASPSVRASRIVGYGGGDYDDPAADALGGSRGPGHGPPPVGGYDDAAGQGRVNGGGTPIEDPSAAPGYGGGTPIRTRAADSTGVRKSRIVGIGGGGGADPAQGGDWDETVSFVPPARPPADIGSPWREFVDPLGVPYFHNDQTQETTWIAPDDWVRDMSAKDPVQRSKSIVRAANDWQEKVDPASGRVYYITPDGQTQWERPESVFVEGGGPGEKKPGEEKPGVRRSRIVGFGGGGDADRLELPPKLEGTIDAPECAPVGRIARASSRELMTTPEELTLALDLPVHSGGEERGFAGAEGAEAIRAGALPGDRPSDRLRRRNAHRGRRSGAGQGRSRPADEAPSVRKSRIVGMGGGGDDDDDDEGPSKVYGGGTPIEDVAAAPGEAGRGRADEAPSVRKSRIVGMGGGGDDDDDDEGPSKVYGGGTPIEDVAAAPGKADRGARTRLRRKVYGGGTPIEDVAAAPGKADRGRADEAPSVRKSRIVGMGGGDDDDDDDAGPGKVYGGGTPIEDVAAAPGKADRGRADEAPSVRKSRIVGMGGGDDDDDDDAGPGKVYGGGTPIEDVAAAPGEAGRGRADEAPSVRKSRIVGMGGGGDDDDDDAGPGKAADEAPSVRKSRIVGMGGGGDDDDDDAGPGKVYGGGTPIEDVAAAPGKAGRGRADEAPSVRKSRIVGMGGGGDDDDDDEDLARSTAAERPSRTSQRRRARPVEAARTRLRRCARAASSAWAAAATTTTTTGPGKVYGGGTPIEDVAAAPGEAGRGRADEAPSVYGGGTPIEDVAAAPGKADRGRADEAPSVRKSRIVGMGGGGDDDDDGEDLARSGGGTPIEDVAAPGKADRGRADEAPSVRKSRIVGMGGGDDDDDDDAGPGKVYGGGTPIEDVAAAPGEAGRGRGRGSVGAQEPHRRHGRRRRRRRRRRGTWQGLRRRNAHRGRRSGAGRGRSRRGRGPSVRKSRIVGMGGGGDDDDDDAGPGKVYGGGTPIEDVAAAPGEAGRGRADEAPSVRKSRIVGMGGGGDDDDDDAGPSKVYGGGTPIEDVAAAPGKAGRGRADEAPSVRKSRIVGMGGGGDDDDDDEGPSKVYGGGTPIEDVAAAPGEAGRGRGRGSVGAQEPHRRHGRRRRRRRRRRGPSKVYGGGTPIEDVAAAPGEAGRGRADEARWCARAASSAWAAAATTTTTTRDLARSTAAERPSRTSQRRRARPVEAADEAPSVRKSRIVGMGGGGDDDDDDAGPGKVYGGGTPIEDVAAAPGEAGRGRADEAPSVRKSRIVGMGGGGDDDDDDAGPSKVYGGGTPIGTSQRRRARPVEAARRARSVRKSRIVGMGGGGDDDDDDEDLARSTAAERPSRTSQRRRARPVEAARIEAARMRLRRCARAASWAWAAATTTTTTTRDLARSTAAERPSRTSQRRRARPIEAARMRPAVRKSRIVGMGGGDDDDDDDAGPGKVYGGGTPIVAGSGDVPEPPEGDGFSDDGGDDDDGGGDARAVVRKSRIVGMGGDGGDARPRSAAVQLFDGGPGSEGRAPRLPRGVESPSDDDEAPSRGAAELFDARGDPISSSKLTPSVRKSRIVGVGGGGEPYRDRSGAVQLFDGGPGGGRAPSLVADSPGARTPRATSGTRPRRPRRPARRPRSRPAAGARLKSRSGRPSAAAPKRREHHFLRKGDGRRCAETRAVADELRRQDERNRTVWRRRSSIVSAAKALKGLDAAARELHYAQWDPTNRVDTSWKKGYAGTVELLDSDEDGGRAGGRDDTPRWTQRVDARGVPYFADDARGETRWDAPDAWVDAQRAGRKLPEGVVRERGAARELVDPATKRVYYVDGDGPPAWERPPAFADDTPRKQRKPRRPATPADDSAARAPAHCRHCLRRTPCGCAAAAREAEEAGLIDRAESSSPRSGRAARDLRRDAAPVRALSPGAPRNSPPASGASTPRRPSVDSEDGDGRDPGFSAR
ncbi:hypothetical protein JL721_9195 [Aureococcus anophagefferens]|nr:hypothetical protein JL721_9195 [Aureococcus anophagefferens]